MLMLAFKEHFVLTALSCTVTVRVHARSHVVLLGINLLPARDFTGDKLPSKLTCIVCGHSELNVEYAVLMPSVKRMGSKTDGQHTASRRGTAL